ncbi:MAG: hypothetical protein RPS47_17940 [Colwellia sp.]|jgi:hypothetical protein
MKKKFHAWYQPPALVTYAIREENSLMTIFSSAKLNPKLIGKKNDIKLELMTLGGASNRISSDARELLLLTSKVNIGDIVILPLDDKGLKFKVAQVASDYKYTPSENIIHSRSLELSNRTWIKDDLPLSMYRALSDCLKGKFLKRVSFKLDEVHSYFEI